MQIYIENVIFKLLFGYAYSMLLSFLYKSSRSIINTILCVNDGN